MGKGVALGVILGQFLVLASLAHVAGLRLWLDHHMDGSLCVVSMQLCHGVAGDLLHREVLL